METEEKIDSFDIDSSSLFSRVGPPVSIPSVSIFSNNLQWSQDGNLSVLNSESIIIIKNSIQRHGIFQQFSSQKKLCTTHQRIVKPPPYHEDNSLIIKQLSADQHLPHELTEYERVSFILNYNEDAFLATSWGPYGSSENNSCLIATVLGSYRVLVFKSPSCGFEFDWVEVVDLSEIWCKYVTASKDGKFDHPIRETLSVTSLSWLQDMLTDDSSLLAISGRRFVRIFKCSKLNGRVSFSTKPVYLDTHSYGNVICSTWLPQKDRYIHQLCLGTSNGNVIITNINSNDASYFEIAVNHVLSSPNNFSNLVLTSFNSEDKMYLLAASGNSITIWNNDTNIPVLIKTWKAHENNITGLVAGNSGHIISSSLDGKIKYWNEKGEMIYSDDREYPCYALSISYNSVILACSTLHDGCQTISTLRKKDHTQGGLYSSIHIFITPQLDFDKTMLQLINRQNSSNQAKLPRMNSLLQDILVLEHMYMQQTTDEQSFDSLPVSSSLLNYVEKEEKKRQRKISESSEMDLCIIRIRQIIYWLAINTEMFDGASNCVAEIEQYFIYQCLNNLVKNKFAGCSSSDLKLSAILLADRLNGSGNPHYCSLAEKVYQKLCSKDQSREECPVCRSMISSENRLSTRCSKGHEFPRCFVSLRLIQSTRPWCCSGCGAKAIRFENDMLDNTFLSKRFIIESDHLVCLLCGSACQ